MSINIFTGLPGSGKSHETARLCVDLLYRNRKWYEKSGTLRPVVSNLKMCKEIEDEFGFGTENSFLYYWTESDELPKIVNSDVLWEEMGVIVDSRNWENMPLELRRWLAQHRHRGVDIYGNVQDLADVDIAVRRLCANAYTLKKIIGSRDPHPTSPPVKYIWGIVLKFKVDPRKLTKDNIFQTETMPSGMFFITRKTVGYYDMHNDIVPGKLSKLQHRQRFCDTCGYVKTVHV